MAGPPKDISPSELFQKLHEMPAPGEELDYPRKDLDGNPIGRIWIQVLSMKQQDQARFRARKWLKEKGMTPESGQDNLLLEIQGDAAAKEVLAMAVFQVTADGQRARMFRHAGDVDELPADEVAALFNSYIYVQHKYGPTEATISGDDETNEWIKRLAEGASELPLARIASPQLISLTFTLARRAYLLSSVLESQLSSLPDTLAADLKRFAIGTGYYGQQQNESGETSFSERSEDLTAEEAENLAREMHSD